MRILCIISLVLKELFILSVLPPLKCCLTFTWHFWDNIKPFHRTVCWPWYSLVSLTFVTVDDDVPICQAYGLGGAQQIFVPVWSQRIFLNCVASSFFPLLCSHYTLSCSSYGNLPWNLVNDVRLPSSTIPWASEARTGSHSSLQSCLLEPNMESIAPSIEGHPPLFIGLSHFVCLSPPLTCHSW